MLTRRYHCSNPKCSKVQAAVKNRLEKEKLSSAIYVGVGRDKRLITEQERAQMREGQLDGIPAATIDTILHRGWSFQIADAR